MSSQSHKILILGANSAIAHSVARLYAHQGCELVLVSRNLSKLEAMQKDLVARGAAKVFALEYDLGDVDKHAALVAEVYKHLERVDVALLAHGVLGNPTRAMSSSEHVQELIHINLTSPVSLLVQLALRFEQAKAGTLAVITSVAGDRGRAGNPVYGAAKGGLSVFLSGLRQRLFDANIQVLDIRPGFVDTPMTVDFKKGPLWAQPEQIAKGILKAIACKKDVVYLPWFWTWIMLIIRWIPEMVFKRAKAKLS